MFICPPPPHTIDTPSLIVQQPAAPPSTWQCFFYPNTSDAMILLVE